jgi:hypothetical protein
MASCLLEKKMKWQPQGVPSHDVHQNQKTTKKKKDTFKVSLQQKEEANHEKNFSASYRWRPLR